ncbi:hypothetical protein U1Q18_013020 [Sarracenia purpurea var. burkii]
MQGEESFWDGFCHFLGSEMPLLNFLLTLQKCTLGLQSGEGMRLSEVGDVMEVWEDERRNGWKGVSEVDEREGSLWIGSIRIPFVGIQERKFGWKLSYF